MSSLNHCIKFELDVKDENIVFKDYFYKSIKLQRHKIYEAELIQPACPFCGSLDLLHNGHLITNIHYPTANASLPVIIRLAKQRVKCRDCDHWSMAQSELVNKYCSISNASKLKVLSALTEDRSMTSIARENNVSINTVQRVLGNCSHRFIDSYEYLPAHLAFDEFKGVDRQLHFICLDGDNHQVVQIFLERATRRRCLSILAVSRPKLELTLRRSQWILIFTIKISSELVFLTLRLSSIVFI
ncbi:transposase [Lactobacillus kefiranofaciens subsp. kefirgranum DSM 10550 = JCM 8572]|nr:transposase [Lactobacillus kefiranofaciens subsp. kefirgranum DSM 10550 = JCM 8572]